MKTKQFKIAAVFLAAAILLGTICWLWTGVSHKSKATATTGTELPGLTYDHRMALDYATMFSVDYYDNGYILLTVKEDGRFLIVPEGESDPSGLPSDITILEQPKDNIYLASTSVMDFFDSLSAIDAIRYSGSEKDDWSIENAKTAMENGSMIYAGKYSEPDYETLVSGGCTLAIESTMIHHKPEVKEKLESMQIPVLVDRSSYEDTPLGRAEWLRFYGALLGKEDTADELFASLEKKAAAVTKKADADTGTSPTMAFFYVSTNDYISIRKPGDYVSSMIESVGGSYLPSSVPDEDDTELSTMKISMEEFYADAIDADFLIYNSWIYGEITSLSDLTDKCSVLADFSAVKSGNVWCTKKDFFQNPTSAADIMTEFYEILHGTAGDGSTLTYFYKVPA